MSRIASLLLAAIAALTVAARERSAAELCDAAAVTLQQKHAARARSWADRPIQVLQRQDNLSIVGYPDGGYAFISHDDRFPAVLGYCDGLFTAQGLPPVLTSYLDDLDGYLGHCLATGAEFRVIQRAGGVNGSVGPLVTTLWDQGSPYYTYCPKWNGANCVTGCVATAAAMVLNYHQLPKTMHGRKIYTYTTQGKTRNRIDYNYGDFTIDWDNMRDKYTGNGITREQNLAVARLMYTCGVNASMTYTTSESGAFTYTEADGINWFMDGVRADYYPLSGNEQLLFDELDALRPVIYSGSNGEGGHAFVVDGYDEEGRLHCNLGWSGAGNYYYAITDMAGYKNGQAFVTVYPSEEPNYTGTPGADMPFGRVTVTPVPVDEIVPDTQWYLLYNVGRSSHPYTQGKGKVIMNTCYFPVDDEPAVAAPHIVRFVTSTNESKPGYFIQSGEGWYFGSLKQGGNKGTTSTKTCNFNFARVRRDTPGYFYIRDVKDDLIMDSNGAGADMVGYGNVAPTDTTSNASWQLFPVTFSVPEGVQSLPADAANASPAGHPAPVGLDGRPAALRPRHSYNIIIENGRKRIK